ncbi:MAG: alpha/beta hydrolase [Bacteroidota bacterium]
MIILLIISPIISFSQQTPPKAPKGYFNNTILKISHALGRLKLIETDFPLPDNIKEHKDIVYKTVDSKDLKLDIYHKKSISTTTPLIIFIHGGSWKRGDKQEYWPYFISYSEKGYITATIQYRLSDTAKYPAQIDDIESAITWIKDNAEKYHIDKNKIVLVGGSAGGHLAMLTGYSKPHLSIKGIVNLYGPSDLTTEYARNKDAVIKLMGQSFEKAPDLYKKASPIFYVSENTPPTLTFHGTLDELVPYQQSDNLDRIIKEAGAISYYHKLKGWPHIMDLSVEVNRYCQYYMDRFFEKYIPME